MLCKQKVLRCLVWVRPLQGDPPSVGRAYRRTGELRGHVADVHAAWPNEYDAAAFDDLHLDGIEPDVQPVITEGARSPSLAIHVGAEDSTKNLNTALSKTKVCQSRSAFAC
jgi:hypothetical protein